MKKIIMIIMLLVSCASYGAYEEEYNINVSDDKRLYTYGNDGNNFLIAKEGNEYFSMKHLILEKGIVILQEGQSKYGLVPIPFLIGYDKKRNTIVMIVNDGLDKKTYMICTNGDKTFLTWMQSANAYLGKSLADKLKWEIYVNVE